MSDSLPRLGYVTSRFPHLTETFILNEIRTLHDLGCNMQLFSLRSPLARLPVHAHALPFVAQTAYSPYLRSRQLLVAQTHFWRTAPAAYGRTLAALVRHNLPSFYALGKALLVFPKATYFARLAQAHGVQHVHASFASIPATGAWIMSQLTGIPFSFTARAADIYGQMPNRHNSMLTEKLRAAAFVVTIHEQNRRYLVDTFGAWLDQKLTIIHSAIDVDRFQRTERARSPASPWRVLAVGRLIEKKGFDYLVQACGLLHDQGYALCCDVVGEGSESAALRSLIDRQGLGQVVRLHDMMTQERLLSFYEQADVFVAPSVVATDGDRDGIPNVLMEALAMQLPAVASRVSGIPELIIDGETGLLAPPGDVKALAAALERLFCDPVLRERLGRLGRERILAEFDRRANGARLLQLIQGSLA